MSKGNKSIALDCRGFFTQVALVTVPDHTGVYFVYGGVPTQTGCSIRHLIYIGKSEDLHEHLNSHEKLAAMNARCDKASGEIMYFAYAFVANTDLADVEGALIKHFAQSHDLLNETSVNGFVSQYETISLSLTGDGVPHFLSDTDRKFTVNPQFGK